MIKEEHNDFNLQILDLDISQKYESKYNGLPLFAVFCFTKTYLQNNRDIGNRIVDDFPSIHNFAI